MNFHNLLHPGFHFRKRVAAAYQQHVDYRREAALRMWVAFIATFVFLRFLTYGIRYHFLPARNIVTSGGLHIHHFVWGILILLIVGFLGISIDSPRLHGWLALAFGIGAALVIDEYALWLNLRDVYWLHEGQVSIDVAIVIGALLGLYYAADRFWKQVVRELQAAFKFAASANHVHHTVGQPSNEGRAATTAPIAATVRGIMVCNWPACVRIRYGLMTS